MNALVLFLIIIIIIIIIIFIYVFSNTFVINSNNCQNNCQNKLFQNNCQNKFQNKNKKNTPSIPKGCYQEEWGINSVGYELDTYPSIENYSYKFYNNNLMNTDQQNIPYNPGNNIPDN